MKDFVLHDTIQILTNFAYYPFEHNCFHFQEVLVDCNNVEDGNWMTHDALLQVPPLAEELLSGPFSGFLLEASPMR